MVSLFFSLLAAAIPLHGVCGNDLAVASELDGCNVRLGDPMAVTISFSGPVGFDFASLRPPELEGGLDASVWRLDREPVRTETRYRNPSDESSACGRVFTYGIRPLQEGVLAFPELAFSYTNAVQGVPVTVRTGAIPVHVRPALQVTLVEELLTDDERPLPDGLLVDLEASPWGSGEGLTDDERFAWRKACLNPTAEAFAAFDFPEARLNEAACEILADRWSRALAIYSALEWQIGQTPAIERGIVAALAVKTQNPAVELPVWRQVLRPILRFALWGRLLSLFVLLLVLGMLVWGGRRLIRALACLLVVALPASVLAFGPFGGGFPGMNIQMSFGDESNIPPADIKAKAFAATVRQSVGQVFELIVELSMDKTCSIQSLQLVPAEDGAAVSVIGPGEVLAPGRAEDGRRKIRYSVPVRADRACVGKIGFTAVGQMHQQGLVETAHSRSSFSISKEYQVPVEPLVLEIEGNSTHAAPDPAAGLVARVQVDPAAKVAGCPFEVVFSLSGEKVVAIERLSEIDSPDAEIQIAANPVVLADESSGTAERKVRLAVPVQLKDAFSGEMRFSISGRLPGGVGRYPGSDRTYRMSPVTFSVMTEPVRVEVAPPPVVSARIRFGSTNIITRQAFDAIVELDVPKGVSVEEPSLSAVEGMPFAKGQGVPLTDGETDDPARRVLRFSVPMRYDFPFKGSASYRLRGQLYRRIRYPSVVDRNWPRQFVQGFDVRTPPVLLDIDLPSEGRPDDFSGAVGSEFRLTQSADRTEVRTNDVVTLICTLTYNGILPADLGLGRAEPLDRWGNERIVFRRYLVADGRRRSDDLKLTYYDVSKKAYCTASAPGVSLSYRPDDDKTDGMTFVNAKGESVTARPVTLRFAPDEGAKELCTLDANGANLKVTEAFGAWVRIDDGKRAGWVKKEDLP